MACSGEIPGSVGWPTPFAVSWVLMVERAGPHAARDEIMRQRRAGGLPSPGLPTGL